MHRTVRPRTALTSAAAALAAAALFAVPAAAATDVQDAGCPDVPTVQPFAPWQDLADYFLAPDGDIEAGASTWLLDGGASAVEGNEPFAVGTATDHMSLQLPAGSSATTAPMCIDATHKTMRFFGSGATSGTLKVHALYTKRNGDQKAVRLGTVQGSGAWAPSEALPMRVNEKAERLGNALSVSLRFTPGGGDAWRIDDVYVDPYRVG